MFPCFRSRSGASRRWTAVRQVQYELAQHMHCIQSGFGTVCVCVCVEHEVSRKKPRLMLAESNGHADSAEITSHKHQDKAYYLDASKEGNVARFINVRHQLLITTEKNFFIMRFKNTNYEMKS